MFSNTISLNLDCKLVHIELSDLFDQEPSGENVTLPTNPLHRAIYCENDSAISDLINSGADVNAKDSSNLPKIPPVNTKKNKYFANLLLNYGLKIHALSIDNSSPLDYAIITNNIDVANKLLEKGCDVNATSTDLFIPLMNLLPGNFTLSRVKTVTKVSPLHRAIKKKNDKMVELLLEHGADVNATNAENSTPLHEATKSTYDLTYHCERDCDDRVRRICYKYNQETKIVHIVESLLRKGAEVNVVDQFNATPLHYAIKGRNCRIVELLLQNGADVNHLDSDYRTPLHYAVMEDNEDIAKLLIEHGAGVNLVNKKEPMPVMCTAASTSLTMVKFLLLHGAQVNCFNRDQETPLHRAVKHQQYCITNLLLRFRFDVNMKNKIGLTALHYASRWRHWSPEAIFTIENLLASGADINIPDMSNGQSVLQVHELEHDFTVALLKHTARLKIANAYLSPINLEIFNTAMKSSLKRMLLQICEEAKEEIEKMEEKPILKLILTRNAEDIGWRVKNEDVLTTVITTDFRESFPIYGRIIERRVYLGLQRILLLSIGYKIVETICNKIYHLPDTCVRQITKSFSNVELRCLMDTFRGTFKKD